MRGTVEHHMFGTVDCPCHGPTWRYRGWHPDHPEEYSWPNAQRWGPTETDGDILQALKKRNKSTHTYLSDVRLHELAVWAASGWG